MSNLKNNISQPISNHVSLDLIKLSYTVVKNKTQQSREWNNLRNVI